MGKGDIRTKKGKIYRGTYGNTRKKAKAEHPAPAGRHAAPDPAEGNGEGPGEKADLRGVSCAVID